ncbi:MAG: ParB/RepB/Spo0J family partition protein [Sphingomonadaceae bacterium]|nr:ParB/RepB/Spo0J family partition protein [Sphingomonadaceae bacterium]
MAAKPRQGLGRGLAALLEDVAEAPQTQAAALIAVHQIRPNLAQPRRHFDQNALKQLADSIREHGVLQPILLRRTGADAYEIVAGERRWRAAQQAGIHDIPAVVREFDDRTVLTAAIVENVQRADLNAIEEGASYKRLVDEFGYAHEDIASAVGKSRSHIANLIRLLDLPSAVQAHVIEGALTMGHARAILASPEPERLAEEVIARGLSVRETERRAAARSRDRASGTGAPIETKAADVRAIEKLLSDTLGLKVAIEHADSGGRVSIRYQSLDQLDMICARLSDGPV